MTGPDSQHHGEESDVLVSVAFAGCGLELVAGGAGAVSPDRFGGLTAAVAGVCFFVGIIAFLYGYAVGVVRSREERITLGGLFFLTGTAPPVVRRQLRAALVVQVIIAAIAASIRPYTAVAFIVLAPMLGLGMMAAWGARHGTFFAKDDSRLSGESAARTDESEGD